jgi:hypothetical protein
MNHVGYMIVQKKLDTNYTPERKRTDEVNLHEFLCL